MRSIGIQPDILLCRSDRPLSESARSENSFIYQREKEAVIPLLDVDFIYQIPIALHDQGLDKQVVEQLNLTAKDADLHEWQRVDDAFRNPEGEVTIGMVGKYIDLADSYKSLSEALRHAGIQTRTRVNIEYIDSEDLEQKGAEKVLADLDAILVPGGFGKRGIEGKILAAKICT